MTSRYRCETCSHYSYPIKDVPSCDHPVVGKHTYLSDEVRFAYCIRGCTHHSDYYNLLDQLFNMLEMDEKHLAFILDENAGMMTFSIQDIEQYITELKGEME